MTSSTLQHTCSTTELQIRLWFISLKFFNSSVKSQSRVAASSNRFTQTATAHSFLQLIGGWREWESCDSSSTGHWGIDDVIAGRLQAPTKQRSKENDLMTAHACSIDRHFCVIVIRCAEIQFLSFIAVCLSQRLQCHSHKSELSVVCVTTQTWVFKRFRVLPALLFLLFELEGGVADVLRGSAGFLLLSRLSLCRLHHVAVDAIRMLRTTAGKQREQTTEGPESKQHAFN